MTTIDSLDNEWYRKHARAVKDLEDTYKNFLRVANLDQAHSVQPHTWVESLENQIPLVDLLMGIYAPERKTIAFFTRPFSTQRRSPIGLFLLAPTLGSIEKQLADADRVRDLPVAYYDDDDDDKEETAKERLEKRRKNAIAKMYDMLGTLNSWLLEIKGRQSQYQKG